MVRYHARRPERVGPPTLFADYPILPGTFDELISPERVPRPDFRRALDLLAGMSPDAFARAQGLAELPLLNQGVTFSVYSDNRGTEKIFPFCLVPRMVSAAAFTHLERGLEQRLRALGLFLDDIYGEQKILEGRPILRDLVLGAKQYLPALRGVRPPGGVRIHVSGVDLIRDHEGTFRVLEDNLRTPSGVSYVVENRLISKRILPHVFDLARVRRVDHYPTRLAETLRSVSPDPQLHRGRAHAGAVQLGLLRAQLPGADDGDRAGAGARPLRRRRPGVRPRHARAAAGARHLPAHGRRLPRSGGLPAGQRARGARADPRLGQGQRGARQRAGQRRRRRQGGVRRSCPR